MSQPTRAAWVESKKKGLIIINNSLDTLVSYISRRVRRSTLNHESRFRIDEDDIRLELAKCNESLDWFDQHANEVANRILDEHEDVDAVSYSNEGVCFITVDLVSTVQIQ